MGRIIGSRSAGVLRQRLAGNCQLSEPERVRQDRLYRHISLTGHWLGTDRLRSTLQNAILLRNVPEQNSNLVHSVEEPDDG